MEFAFRGGEGICENKGTLLGQPKWCLIATPTVIERDEPSGKPVPRIDPLQLGFGMSWRKKSLGPKARA